MIKWPIAKIMVLQRPARGIKKGATAVEELRNWDHGKQKSDILIWYKRTQAVACNGTTLVYSLPPRTREKGMCYVIRHWT